MQARTTSPTIIAIACAAALTVVACSSATTSPTSTPPAQAGSSQPGSPAGSSAASPPANVAAALAYIEPYLKPARSIGVTDKLKTPAGKAKNLVFITCEDPTCTDFATGFSSAASQFGWHVSKLIASNSDPGADNKQLSQAIALKPDAIVITGGNVPTWKQGLDSAKAAGIPVFGTSMEKYELGSTSGLYATIPVNSAYNVAAGKLMGNWIVADSKATANVVDVDIPELKIPFYPYSQTVDSVLDSACRATCKHATLDIPVADVMAANAPGQIVSYLQAHPQVTYVSMAGGFETGVAPALKQAGLQSVKLLDGSSSMAVEQGVKSGAFAVALGYNALTLGWYTVNAIARHFAGLPPGDSATASPPTSILTAENIITPQNYQEPSDYQQQFRTLWDLQ